MKIQVISGCIGLVLLSTQVLAQERAEPLVESVGAETVKQQINRLNAEGKMLREEAQATFVQEEQACYKKFLVNYCIDQAKQKRLDTIVAAREKEAEARRLTLEGKRQAVVEAEAHAQEKLASRPPEPAEDKTDDPMERMDPVVQPSVEAEQIRAERAVNEKAAEMSARRDRQHEDQVRAQKRVESEAEATARARQAEEDKRRYDERIRRYEEDKKKDEE